MDGHIFSCFLEKKSEGTGHKCLGSHKGQAGDGGPNQYQANGDQRMDDGRDLCKRLPFPRE